MKNNKTSNETSYSDSGFMDMSVEESLLLTSDQERQALNDLNNRFAKYVEHIRHQDMCNNTAKSIESLSDIPSIQLASLRQLFEGEINSIRKTLDDQSNDMAKLRLAHDKLASEKSNYLNELQDKSRVVNELTDKLSKSKAECEKLRTRFTLLKDKENEVSDLKNQLKECQNQLEIEVLLRTSADNACLTYKEKMEFNEAVFKKELGALMTTHRNAIRKLTSLQNNLSSSNILEQMEEARIRLKTFLDEIRLSINENFLKRIENTSNLIINGFTKHSNLAKDNLTLSTDKNELLVELAKIKASHVKLENQLSDLESLHQEEINKLNRMISDISSSQIDDFEDRLRSLQNLNQSLSDKSQLDAEIIVYRKMIESEEDRTNHNSINGRSSEIKKRKMSHVNNLQKSQTFSSSPISATPSKEIRPILRASRTTKSCAIM